MMSIHAIDVDGKYYMGSRVALLPKKGKTNASWVMHPVEGTSNQYLLENKASGYYLSVADSISYRNPVVSAMAERMRLCDPEIDWTSFEEIQSAQPLTSATSSWVPTTKSVTQWQLLPNDTQKWQFNQMSDGKYQIANASTGKALAVVDGALTEVDKASDATQLWNVVKDGGLVSFINDASGLALGSVTQKEKMTEQEMNLNHITDETKAYNYYIVLDVSEYNGSPSQLWKMASSSDLQINVEAGDKWFDVKVEEE